MNLDRIQQLAEHYGLNPSKSKGQNFLHSQEVVEAIVASADLKPGTNVLEIGPGFGILTEHLMKAGFNVVAVELDNKAAAYIRQTYGAKENFTLLEGDILEMKNEYLADNLGGEFHVIANIPYNITSPIIQKFLTYEPRPLSMTLLVQDEVAERIAAQAGQMSILAVSVQLYADAQYIMKVPKEFFWPSPEVNSAVINIRLHDKNVKKLKVTEKQFFQVVKFGFAAKRKKLANTLGAGFRLAPSVTAKWLADLGFGVNARAQELSVEDWIRLANYLEGEGIWKTV